MADSQSNNSLSQAFHSLLIAFHSLLIAFHGLLIAFHAYPRYQNQQHHIRNVAASLPKVSGRSVRRFSLR